MKATVTLELFHPAGFAAGVGEAEIVRADPKVTLRLDAAMLPAISVACTAMVFSPAASVKLQEKFGPFSAAATLLQVTFATPESVSETVPVIVSWGTVTVAAGAGDVMANVGRVLSILSVTEAVAKLPAASVAVREIAWFAPSVEITTGAGQMTAPVPPEHTKLTVTSVLFHPAGLGAGVGVAEIVSVLDPKVTLRFAVAVFPATSVA